MEKGGKGRQREEEQGSMSKSKIKDSYNVKVILMVP